MTQRFNYYTIACFYDFLLFYNTKVFRKVICINLLYREGQMLSSIDYAKA